MTSRERVERALAHREPDRVPIDLGSTSVTGMHASTVYRLRQALGLDRPGTPVKVSECYQMLGETGPDLLDALGADAVGVRPRGTRFGFPSDGWKEWRLFDGTPVLVPGLFNTAPDANGDILQYPMGDASLAPSGRMPNGGFYFDLIVRQPPIDEDRLDPADNLEEFGPLSAATISGLVEDARAQAATGRAVVLNIGGTSFGDVGQIPGPMLKAPKGIRDIEEWYVSTLTRREYVRAVFERQCAIALANLERAHAAVGDLVSVLHVSGADFGTQTGAFVSPTDYRDLWLPVHKAINDWVHAHTRWRTFIHSCGAVIDLVPVVHRGRLRHPEPGAGLGDRHGSPHVEAPVRRPGDVLGRRGGHAEDPAVRDARRGPARGRGADRGARARGRVRLQPGPQRAGGRTGREPARDVRHRAGARSVPVDRQRISAAASNIAS